MDREEHLEWAKKRAREYLNSGDPLNAVTSMLSDLEKHGAWKGGKLSGTMLMLFAMDKSSANARRIIEGFN